MYVHISVYWCVHVSDIETTILYVLLKYNLLSVWKWQARVFLFRYLLWMKGWRFHPKSQYTAALNVPQIKTSNIRHGLVPKVETTHFQSFFLRLRDKISYPNSVPGKVLAVRLANKGPRNKCTLCYTTASCIRTAIHTSRAFPNSRGHCTRPCWQCNSLLGSQEHKFTTARDMITKLSLGIILIVSQPLVSARLYLTMYEPPSHGSKSDMCLLCC